MANQKKKPSRTQSSKSFATHPLLSLRSKISSITSSSSNSNSRSANDSPQPFWLNLGKTPCKNNRRLQSKESVVEARPAAAAVAQSVAAPTSVAASPQPHTPPTPPPPHKASSLPQVKLRTKKKSTVKPVSDGNMDHGKREKKSRKTRKRTERSEKKRRKYINKVMKLEKARARLLKESGERTNTVKTKATEAIERAIAYEGRLARIEANAKKLSEIAESELELARKGFEIQISELQEWLEQLIELDQKLRTSTISMRERLAGLPKLEPDDRWFWQRWKFW